MMVSVSLINFLCRFRWDAIAAVGPSREILQLAALAAERPPLRLHWTRTAERAHRRLGHPDYFIWVRSAADTTAGVGEEQVVLRLSAKRDIRAIRLRRRDLEPVARAALVVIGGRQEGIGRLFLEEERQRLAAPLDATVELGVGLRELSGVEVGAAEIEVADPRVEQGVGVEEQRHRPAHVLLPETD